MNPRAIAVSAWRSLAEARIDAFSRFAITAMLVSGMLHIPMHMSSNLDWEDPSSFRKPIMFGVSTGVTLWSSLVVLGMLKPLLWDGWASKLLSGSLLVEVSLITIQAWRQVPSHFNRSSLLNATIESAMLLMITIASILIIALTVRAFWPGQWRTGEPAMHLAMQTGLLFLVLSCAIGFFITFVGKWQLTSGGSPSIYPPRGILKFPHGAVMHAIQLFAVLAWLNGVLNASRAILSIGIANAAAIAWFGYSWLQTGRGRGRMELDLSSGSLMAMAFVLGTIAIGVAWWTRTTSGTHAGTRHFPSHDPVSS